MSLAKGTTSGTVWPSVWRMSTLAVVSGVDATVGERAYMLMWRKGISQTVMGKRIALDQSALSRKLRGTRPWYAREIAAMAAILDTSVSYLYGETDLDSPPSAHDGGASNEKVYGSIP